MKKMWSQKRYVYCACTVYFTVIIKTRITKSDNKDDFKDEDKGDDEEVENEEEGDFEDENEEEEEDENQDYDLHATSHVMIGEVSKISNIHSLLIILYPINVWRHLTYMTPLKFVDTQLYKICLPNILSSVKF